jgi:hypothetical protein
MDYYIKQQNKGMFKYIMHAYLACAKIKIYIKIYIDYNILKHFKNKKLQ